MQRQRSRKALLQTRPKLSLSLLFLFWISRSHGYTYTDGSGELPVASNGENKEHEEGNDMLKPPLGLDEFKSRAISSKIKSGTTAPSGNVIHRVDRAGAEYNYASASKGAKVLASNREAKGAANILTKDKDKYLRNPCSSEDKFVIIELSEETLVHTIEIANFEHHSSNLKTFELRSSLVYPTDAWVFLGNFTASNVKQAQRFVLHEPKWVRYLHLNLQSHYGSEFYCTLSVIEVYGVDAVERMLEDLISSSDEDKRPNSAEDDDVSQINSQVSCVKQDVPNPVEEIRQQVGRMPGDTVLKILMQKVRFLDLNLSVLEQYTEELNSRYVNIFKVYSKDIAQKDILIQMLRQDISSFLHQQDAIINDVSNFDSWKSHISMQLDHVRGDNAVLRSEVENVRENQAYLENKGVLHKQLYLQSSMRGGIVIYMMTIWFPKARWFSRSPKGMYMYLLQNALLHSIHANVVMEDGG
ncbi:hypothetical protein PIB30_021538 [Stylosanthes scabra]|uniref:SUN domain-containing protein n=1 Tax=Stylosanthes scabra TaxID=79078 RepID=A0ABU6S9D7_9FABA|nr:hypothetical protein [Stylosanthes scabra]